MNKSARSKARLGRTDVVCIHDETDWDEMEREGKGWKGWKGGRDGTGCWDTPG